MNMIDPEKYNYFMGIVIVFGVISALFYMLIYRPEMLNEIGISLGALLVAFSIIVYRFREK